MIYLSNSVFQSGLDLNVEGQTWGFSRISALNHYAPRQARICATHGSFALDITPAQTSAVSGDLAHKARAVLRLTRLNFLSVYLFICLSVYLFICLATLLWRKKPNLHYLGDDFGAGVTGAGWRCQGAARSVKSMPLTYSPSGSM